MKRLKRLTALLLAVITVFIGTVPVASAADSSFTDITPGAYYYDAVLWAVENNITSGTSATTFSPNATCTRGQVVTFLWRSNGSPEPKTSSCPFSDVVSGAYYYKAVLWAVENNVTAGTSATTFSPNASCTRGQVVTFLHRAQGKPAISTTSCPFNDIKTGAYYYDAVLWAVENHVTAGTSATTFSPDSTCTRGQIVTFLYRALNKSSQNPTEYESYEDFGKATSALVKENPVVNWSATAAADNDFYSSRLIVQASSPIDLDRFNPSNYIVGPDNLYLVQFESSRAAEKAFKELANMQEVVYVEPDGYLGSGDYQEAATEPKSWGVKAIGADKLAEYVGSTTNNSITVAVVDTGVSNHTFLDSRILSGGYDFVDNDKNPSDMHYHGTHVAGTIVDCTPGINVYILPVRVLDENGNGYSSMVGAGIRYAADHGAKVINLSLGGGHSNYVDSAVQYAINRGVCVVVAAGNDYGNTSDHCPAHITSAITVGAVDSNLQKAAFSNSGSSLDIVCPGVGIASCIPGGGYKTLDGTSMATPHAAAAVAMLRLLYPSKTPSEIESLLRSHTTDLGDSGWDVAYGSGLPNLKQFVAVVPTGISLNRTSLSLVVGGSSTLVATVSPSNATDKTVTWSTSNSSVATVSSGGTVTAKGTGSATITAKTVNGWTATCSVTVSSVSVSSISIYSKPNKTSYYIGETLDTTGLKLTVYYNNGTSATVSSGYSCSPTSFSSSGTKTITVYYSNYSTSFTVSVSTPSISLDTSYESISKDCWDSYWNKSREVPLWKIYVPTVTTYPSNVVYSWSIVSGQAYYYGPGSYVAAQQPGRIVARATMTYCGYTYTADYTVDLSIYKVPTATNYLRSSPSTNGSVLTTVPTGAKVWITEVYWDPSLYSNGSYYLWGKTSYNGYSGWIVIS